MSRIYDDKPLLNLPLISIENLNWKPDHDTEGKGLLLEGIVKRRSKVSVTGSTGGNGSKCRYYVLHTDIQKAHRRKYDPSGKEITPNFSETQKVNKGFLNTYKVEAKGESDKVNKHDVSVLLKHSQIEQVYQKNSTLVTSGCVSLWLPEIQSDKIEISDGDSLRITTRGNSPFIENLTKMEVDSSTVSNFAGEQVGGNWTDKIMSMKSNEKEEKVEQDDDNEWDD